MNKFIKKELEKVNIPLPAWDNNTTHLIISREGNTQSNDFTIGGSYSIVIEDYIINEPSNFTLSSNWNGGTKPPEHNMSVKVVKTMGKMIYVEGIGKDTKIGWSGWLPRKGFKII